MNALKDILKESGKKVTGTSGIEKEFRSFIQDTLSATGESIGKSNVASRVNKDSRVFSSSETLSRESSSQKFTSKEVTATQPKTVNVNNDVTGTIRITIDGAGANGLTQQQLNQIFNSEGFKQYIANLGKDTKGAGFVNYQ